MAKDKETPVGNFQTIAVSLDQHDSVSWKWLSNGVEQEPLFALDEVVLRTLADYDFLKGLIEDNLKGDLKREASRRLGKALVDSFIEIETGSIKNRKTNHLAQAKRFVGGMLTQSARISALNSV